MSNSYEGAVKSRDFVGQVAEFNRFILKVDGREKSLLSEKELDYALKAGDEELTEFKTAHRNHDFIGAVDAVVDLMYFSVGFLIRMGLTEQQIRDCMSAVHEANMQKTLGVVDKRGGEGVADATKPEGWVAPEERIAAILGD